MTDSSEFDLPELAVPYALDAVTDAERAEIERRLATAPDAVAEAFRSQVAEARETLVTLSDATAVPPPAALSCWCCTATGVRLTNVVGVMRFWSQRRCSPSAERVRGGLDAAPAARTAGRRTGHDGARRPQRVHRPASGRDRDRRVFTGAWRRDVDVRRGCCAGYRAWPIRCG